MSFELAQRLQEEEERALERRRQQEAEDKALALRLSEGGGSATAPPGSGTDDIDCVCIGAESAERRARTARDALIAQRLQQSEQSLADREAAQRELQAERVRAAPR